MEGKKGGGREGGMKRERKQGGREKALPKVPLDLAI